MGHEIAPKGTRTAAGILGAAIAGALIGGLVVALFASLVGLVVGGVAEIEEAQKRRNNCHNQ